MSLFLGRPATQAWADLSPLHPRVPETVLPCFQSFCWPAATLVVFERSFQG